MTRSRLPDPWLSVLLLVTVGPVLCGLLFMLVYASGGIGMFSSGWTFVHWRAVFIDGEVWTSLGYSLALGLASLAIAAAAALWLHEALGSRMRSGVLRRLFFVPLAFPALVAALVSVELFSNAGLAARVAYHIGLIGSPADFPNLLFAPSGSGIVLTHVLLVTPALVLLFESLARHERIDELVWLARTLGASPAQAWMRVTVPVLLRAGAPTLAVYGVVLIGAYEIPLIVGSQYPEMISVLVQRRFADFDVREKAEAYAIASLYALLSMGLLVALFARRRSTGTGTNR